MARTSDISPEGQKTVRDAIKSGGPLPFVPSGAMRGESQQMKGGNPFKVPRMRPVKVDPVVLQRIVDGARRKR